MIDAVLAVLTKAVPGREADMEDWYSNIHFHDVLRFRGSIAAQRFRLSTDQPDLPVGFDWQFLALYDVFDPERFAREHMENALTSRMQVTDAIDDSILYDFHYYPIQFRDNDPEAPHQGGLVLEEMRPIEGGEVAFRRWYEENRLPEAMATMGAKSGAFLMYRKFGQLAPMQPDYSFIAIYRLNDSAACAAWKGARSQLLASGLLADDGFRVTHWEPVAARLTKDQAQHPTAAFLAAEERARERMGSRVKTGGLEKLSLS